MQAPSQTNPFSTHFFLEDALAELFHAVAAEFFKQRVREGEREHRFADDRGGWYGAHIGSLDVGGLGLFGVPVKRAQGARKG